MEPTAILLVIVAFIFGAVFMMIMSTAQRGGGSPFQRIARGGGTGGSGGGSLRSQDLKRIEAKVDFIFKELGLTVPAELVAPPAPKGLSPEVLALLPVRKIDAIKLAREQTGLGLKECKDLIDEACRDMRG